MIRGTLLFFLSMVGWALSLRVGHDLALGQLNLWLWLGAGLAVMFPSVIALILLTIRQQEDEYELARLRHKLSLPC